MNYSLQKMFTTKMTRREFLVYLGTIFVGFIGIPSILNLLVNSRPKLTKHDNPPSSTSYGTGAYGI